MSDDQIVTYDHRLSLFIKDTVYKRYTRPERDKSRCANTGYGPDKSESQAGAAQEPFEEDTLALIQHGGF